LAEGQFKAEASADMLARLEAVLNYAQVGVAFSRLSHIELVSQHYCTVFACEQSEVMGQPTRIMYPSDEAYEALSARARPAFMEFGAFEGELELVRRNGERFWASMRGRAVVPGNLAMGTIWIIEDVTLAREQRERLTYNATHDALTGLANRLAFESALGKATAMVAKHSFSALFMDLDRFKQVNDTGGHAAGDALLKGIAEALHACVRGTDMVARLGGDEFAVLLPRCPEDVALNLAERMRAAVEGYALEMDGRRHTVGVSIGLVHVDERFASGADVVRAADAACYAAKHAGRNCVVAYSSVPPVAPVEAPDPEAAALAGQSAPL
jgi:diguanylate cyclase (GGDEF)-like protein/PAS domain S-box-containing protein